MHSRVLWLLKKQGLLCVLCRGGQLLGRAKERKSVSESPVKGAKTNTPSQGEWEAGRFQMQIGPTAPPGLDQGAAEEGGRRRCQAGCLPAALGAQAGDVFLGTGPFVGGGTEHSSTSNASFTRNPKAPQWEAGEGVCGPTPSVIPGADQLGLLLPVSLIPPTCLPICHMALLSIKAEQEGQLRGQEDVWVLPLRLFWEPKLGSWKCTL